MWDWLKRYPSVSIEQIATPYDNKASHNGAEEFDYIIVGGGTAGCVLANRLSANPEVKVLVIERGTLRDSFFATCVPLSMPGPVSLFPQKEILSVPQSGLSDKQLSSFEGLSLGGRTCINACNYLPGSPEEYKSWGKRWQWDEVGPAFARMERRLELEHGDPRSEQHEWKTRPFKGAYESSRQFASALERLGVPSVESYTHHERPGCFGIYPRFNIDSAGRRHTTYHAFLPKRLVRERNNLTICLNATVQRILFSDTTKKLKPTGLLVENEKRHKFFVRANHEIILCAGAIVTPQLLLLSGLGPKEHFADISKPCIHDLAGVGSTLNDHFLVPVNFEIPIRHSAHQLMKPFFLILALLQFIIFGTGILLSVGCEYFCFLQSQELPPKENRKSHALSDLELFWAAGYGDYTDPVFFSGKGMGCIFIQRSIPKSSGSVRLSPNGVDDIRVDPLVDPGYMSASEDWPVYRRGILFALEIGKEMASGGYPIQELQPPDSSAPGDLDRYIRRKGISGQHMLSSCRMKPLSEGGVVDQELKVHEIDGLRIADGSIFPDIVASRPQASAAMVGERCAEFIREGWRREGLFRKNADFLKPKSQ